MAAVQSPPPLLPPRADALYRTIERWIDAAIHVALSNSDLSQQQRARALPLLQRWRQRVMLEVHAISDERGLLDLLSQIDQLVARTSGHIDPDTPLITIAPPEEQVRDELVAAYEEERERLTAVSEDLEVANKRLQAEVANKRALVEECEREIRSTVEFVNQAKMIALSLNDAQASEE